MRFEGVNSISMSLVSIGFDGGVEVERLVDLSSGFLILIEGRAAV